MNLQTISVARVLELHVPIAWQEAVEVVAAAASSAAAEGMPIVLEECRLSATGSVHVARSMGRGTAVSAGELLRVMLAGQQAPPELKTLAEQAGESGKTLDLSWFVRGAGGVEDIARLAVRALAADAQAATESEITRLRNEVSHAPAASAPETSARARAPRWFWAAGVGASAVLAGLAFASTRVPGGLPEVGSQVGSAAAQAMAAIAPIVESTAAAVGLSPAISPETTASEPVVEKKPARPVSRRARPVERSGDAAEATAVTPATEPGGEEPVVAPPETVVVTAAPEENRVYSAEDVDVAPPALVYPKLPSVAKTDSAPTESAMVLTIGEDGSVLRARLAPDVEDPPLHARMLISAVKTWQFQPATRDGRPVPYTLRLPVTR